MSTVLVYGPYHALVLTRRFLHEYELIAGLHGLSADAMRERDAAAPPLGRWYSIEGGAVVGLATARRRPDHRTFLRFAVLGPRPYEPLVRAADAELRCALTTHVDGGAVECVHALAAAGFETEAVGEVFRIRFDLAQRLLRRAWTPSGYRLERADRVDEAGLFTLDNALRNLVPGTDGWTGDRAAFREELTSPEFDAGAYLVAVEEASHDLVGLVRIWRNATGPRLGLVGVLPAHRGQPVAAALLKEALLTAATWGFDEVVSETSPDNTHTYPRLRRMGATPIGSFMQMVRQTRHADA